MGWLTRVAVTLAILGLVGFEVLSIAVTRMTLEDTGLSAADAALSDYRERHDPAAAYQAAVNYAASDGATIRKKSFVLTVDGSVTFEIRKPATTLVIQHIEPLAHYANVVIEVNQSSVESNGALP